MYFSERFYLGKRMPGPRFAKSAKTRHHLVAGHAIPSARLTHSRGERVLYWLELLVDENITSLTRVQMIVDSWQAFAVNSILPSTRHRTGWDNGYQKTLVEKALTFLLEAKPDILLVPAV
jgi:hypothetical protein